MAKNIETVIVGGGQAGLSVSYFLGKHRREHTVLEKAAQPGSAWRDDRWDSFTLVTPNWIFRLPGAEYNGDQPGGYMPRDEIVRRFEAYVEQYHFPVEFGVQVDSVEAENGGYLVKSSSGTLRAKNVVVASGMYQRAKIPAYAAGMPEDILQVHSGKYRNPGALPPGAVLVMGSGQSGCQIAEELYQSGRVVYLATGKAGRAPRRYRGKDVMEWVFLSGFLNRTPAQLPSLEARFASNPLVTGKDGGHSLNLHQFARDGVHLLGRAQDAHDGKVYLAPDLMDNLARTDQFEKNIVQMIDRYIETAGLDAPADSIPELKDGYASTPVSELDLRAAGISTILWAMGHDFDYSLVKLPVVDAAGFPLSERGETAYPGLYFAGMPWLPQQKSGLLGGVGEQAEWVVSRIIDK